MPFQVKLVPFQSSNTIPCQASAIPSQADPILSKYQCRANAIPSQAGTIPIHMPQRIAPSHVKLIPFLVNVLPSQAKTIPYQVNTMANQADTIPSKADTIYLGGVSLET